MYLKQKIPRSSFLSFFDDFRYAGATIVALCSQGLNKIATNGFWHVKNWKKIYGRKIS